MLAANKEQFLEMISNNEFRIILTELVNKYVTDNNDIEDVENLCTILVSLLSKNKILRTNPMTKEFVPDSNSDILIASGLLHRIGLKYENFHIDDIFSARKILEKEVTDVRFELYVDAISQAIESQLGKDSPNKLLTPQLGSPSYYLAEACYIYYEIVKPSIVRKVGIVNADTNKIVATIREEDIIHIKNLLDDNYFYTEDLNAYK